MKPIIRFRQYNKEWCPFKLNTILVPSNEKNTKGLYSKNDVLSVSGEAGIVNQIAFQGRSFAGASVLNYGVVNTNDIVYTKSPLRNNPYGIIKTNNGPSGIVSTLYAIYNCCEESCPQFVDTYFTSSSRTNNYLRPLVRKGAKNDMKVSSEGALQGNVIFPYKDEQIEIASYFRILDAKLQASAKKVESLKKLKSASLVAMFPQQGKTTPKVRFKGFEGEWSKVELCSISKKVTNRNMDMQYTTTLTNSAEHGIIDQLAFFDHQVSNNDNISGYYVVENGDFVYNPRISALAPVGPINQNQIGYTGVMSPLYYVFRVDGVDTDYLSYYFKTTLWHQYLKDVGNSGARFDRLAITDSDFQKMPIYLPTNREEQQAIATFFRSLDRKIALETARLEKLKQIKLACLDKMFV